MDNIYIDKVLRGDSHAFRYFVNTYKDMAFSVAISIVKQEHLAEEIVQEAFLHCYLSLSNFRKESKFSTWFYRMVVHTAYKSLRQKTILSVELELEDHDQELDVNALSQLILAEQKQVINDALMRIPANESLALRLFYLEEMTIKELCEITGWTEANAKVILHRARKKLYTQLHQLMERRDYGT